MLEKILIIVLPGIGYLSLITLGRFESFFISQMHATISIFVIPLTWTVLTIFHARKNGLKNTFFFLNLTINALLIIGISAMLYIMYLGFA